MIVRNMGSSKVRWSIAFGLVLLLSAVNAVVNSGSSDQDGPPGLIDIQNAEDLVAEASVETQKREIPVGGLSNSYGEPIPADSYGPPQEDHSAHIIAPQPIPISDSYGPPSKPDLGLPIPVYGVPDDPSNHIKYPELPPDIPPSAPSPQIGIPHQTYGPPQIPHETYGTPKLNFQVGNQYHGPPPPPQIQYGPPKLQYGPPKQQYGPPKPQFPPKIQYGPPKQIFGPPKIQYGPPKQHYGPPKPIYAPPKPQYGPPKIQYGPPKIQHFPQPPPIKIPHGPPRLEYGPPKVQLAQKPLFLQKPHPIYGPPLVHFEQNQVLKPLFPIPEDTYGPPGRPISPGEQFSQQLISSEVYIPPAGIHHGPPEPDPDPKPAHPGIPAPPTPPHILYDGWTPIPGLVSKPPGGHGGNVIGIHGHGHGGGIIGIQEQGHGGGLIGHGHGGGIIGIQDNYGPPPPPPPTGIEGSFISSLHSTNGVRFGVPSVSYGAPSSIDIHTSGGGSSHSQASNSFVSTGYSSVSGNEGLQGIDLNSILGSSHSDAGIGLQGSKTVFEAHYTEGNQHHGSLDSASQIITKDVSKDTGNSFSVLQSLGFELGSEGHNSAPSNDFRAPPSISFSSVSPYPGRQLLPSADFGLKPPSGIYGVPPGGKYGIPPPPPPHNSFKPPSHGHLAISYGAPSGSIGTGSLFPLGVSPPKRPISFREPVPSGLIENIGHNVIQKDHLGIDSINFHGQGTYLPPPVQELPQKEPVQFAHNSGNSFSVQASIEPTNLYSLPGTGNPINFNSGNFQSNHISGFSSIGSGFDASVLGDSYGAPSHESSITTTIDGKALNSEAYTNSEKTVIGTDAASLAAAILKNCPYHKALYEAAKSVEQQNANIDINSASSSSNVQVVEVPGVEAKNQDTSSDFNSITDSEKSQKDQKGKSLSLNHNNSFQQFKSVSLQNIPHQQLLGQNYEVLHGVQNIPVQGNLGAYTLQIQSANGLGPRAEVLDPVPHEQVLSDGLLQSILQAIEQPHQTQIVPQQVRVQVPQNQYYDLNQAPSGLVLPEGYEIQPKGFSIEQTKKILRGDQHPEEDDSEPEGSENRPVIVVAPEKSDKLTKSFLEQFGINKRDDNPEIVTPLNIIDDNEIAVYFNSNNKNEYENDYSGEEESRNKNVENRDTDEGTEGENDSTETVTEVSVETTISASDDDDNNESQKNAQQYDAVNGNFGDKIVKKVDSKADETL